MTGNVGERFDRLPATPAERTVEGRPSRQELLAWWRERFGVPESVFERFSFWEKGAGKIWIAGCDPPSPIAVEGLGMVVARTRREHWKPTTNAVQRFGHHATRNVLELDQRRTVRFAAGEDQAVAWDGDWGYLIVTHRLAGPAAPMGVGLYIRGELRSTVPKGRRRRLGVLEEGDGRGR